MSENVFDLICSDEAGLVTPGNAEEQDFNSSIMEISDDYNLYDNLYSLDQMGDLSSGNLEDLSTELDKFLKTNYECNFIESGSDSGLSSNADHNVLMSPPSCGVISPDPRGDISVDTFDAGSDVSSSSDLGSLNSFGSSPIRSNGQVTSVGFDSISDEGIDIKDSPCSFKSGYTTEPSPIRTITNKINFSKTSNPTINSSAPQTFPLPVQQQTIPNIKVESSNVPKIVSIKPFGANTKLPILKTFTLDPNSKQPNQAIVVTRGNTVQLANNVKNNNKTVIKTNNGMILPMNVNDFFNMHNMQKVKNITIYPVKKADSQPTVSSVNKIHSNILSSPTSSIVVKGNEARTHFIPNHLKMSSANIDNHKLNPTFTIKEEPSSSDEETPQQGQRLTLSEEEKRLMRKEAITLPSRYPLSKQEERDLKRIRRKIRNKKSAQDSRKRKKEYVDGLEDRVKQDSADNELLRKKIKSLEKQNENLTVQLKRFQNLIGHTQNNRSHNHASTALMMLILSAALIVVPSLKPQETKSENELTRATKMPSSGHTRTLLETGANSLTFGNANNNNLELFEEDEDEEMESESHTGALSDHDYEPSSKKIRTEAFITPQMKPFGKGDPPDVGDGKGVYALLGAMLHQLGTNWTDPGGTPWSSKNHQVVAPDSSVVLKLNRTLRDDLELE